MSIHSDAITAGLPTVGPKSSPPQTELAAVPLPTAGSPSQLSSLPEPGGGQQKPNPPSGSGESPNAVAEAEKALILRHTHLKESLPEHVATAAMFAARVKAEKAEMVEIERLLRAHKRLREPKHRITSYRVSCECGMTIESTRDLKRSEMRDPVAFADWMRSFLEIHNKPPTVEELPGALK